MVICLERGADLHTAQLMPLPLTVSCFSKIQIFFTVLVPAHLGSPGQRAAKRVCLCVCVCVCFLQTFKEKDIYYCSNLMAVFLLEPIQSVSFGPLHSPRGKISAENNCRPTVKASKHKMKWRVLALSHPLPTSVIFSSYITKVMRESALVFLMLTLRCRYLLVTIYM